MTIEQMMWVVICALFIFAIGTFIGYTCAFKAVEKELDSITKSVRRASGAVVEIQNKISDIKEKLK